MWRPLPEKRGPTGDLRIKEALALSGKPLRGKVFNPLNSHKDFPIHWRYELFQGFKILVILGGVKSKRGNPLKPKMGDNERII